MLGRGKQFLQKLVISIKYDISYHRLEMIKYFIYQTEAYKEWLDTQSLKSKRQILDRVLKIEEEGHFGHHKYLTGTGIWELKFNDGRRIYYGCISKESKIILILGGNKNGQEKDIKKAAAIFRKIYTSSL